MFWLEIKSILKDLLHSIGLCLMWCLTGYLWFRCDGIMLPCHLFSCTHVLLFQYLSTPESQSLRCDLIRYICAVIHPSNEVLCSDIIPRWAVIGWLLTTCTVSSWLYGLAVKSALHCLHTVSDTQTVCLKKILWDLSYLFLIGESHMYYIGPCILRSLIQPEKNVVLKWRDIYIGNK